MLEKGGAVTYGEEYGPSQFEANRMMSNTLYHIVEHTPSYQNLINIQVSCYQIGVIPTSYTPTNAGLNPICDYRIPPLSVGLVA